MHAYGTHIICPPKPIFPNDVKQAYSIRDRTTQSISRRNGKCEKLVMGSVEMRRRLAVFARQPLDTAAVAHGLFFGQRWGATITQRSISLKPLSLRARASSLSAATAAVVHPAIHVRFRHYANNAACLSDIELRCACPTTSIIVVWVCVLNAISNHIINITVHSFECVICSHFA